MMAGKEDVMLSLSLGSMENRFPPILQLNLMPSPSSPAPTHRNPKWSDLLAASPQGWETMRGIDVNRAPPPPPPSSAAVAERESEEEEAGASSPNSTLSSVSGKRDHARLTCAAVNGGGSEEQETDPSSSRGGNSDDEDGEGSRKKLRLSKDQSAVLEESFKDHNTLNPKQKLALAKQLNLRPRQVEVWFQNRRARTKLKQTEVDCEFLKRCCENLTEENRRLQKEVAELRALKLSPQLYMHMTPPTTLTMCPSCERVASTPSTAAAAAAATTSAPPPDHHHRSFTTAALVHWAPMPLRTASFMEIHPHRSSS